MRYMIEHSQPEPEHVALLAQGWPCGTPLCSGRVSKAGREARGQLKKGKFSYAKDVVGSINNEHLCTSFGIDVVVGTGLHFEAVPDGGFRRRSYL